MKKWIKVPKPGEYRGEGEWVEIDPNNLLQVERWEECNQTHYLPTREREEKPGDDEK